MTIQQCKYVLEIAKTGSFNEAAKQLFVAQSGLSSSIKQLENELNIKIFERSKNGVCLSVEGAEFVRYAEQIVSQYEFVQSRYESLQVSAKLHVATQHYDFVVDSFCKLLHGMEKEKYDFSICELKTYEVIKEVETAFCDIGIIAIKDNDFDVMSRYLNKKGIKFCEFLLAPPHVYVRKNHSLCKKSSISYDDLLAFPYLSYEQGPHNASFFTEEVMQEFKGNKCVTISDRATLMNVILTTDGFTIGTGIMPSALNNGRIIGLKLDFCCNYHIGYILRKDGKISPLTEKFIELLNSFAKTYQKNN